MFKNCNNLALISSIPIHIKYLKNPYALFDGCSSLKELPDISKWNTNNVTNMSYLFYDCSSLKELPDISKWNIPIKNKEFISSFNSSSLVNSSFQENSEPNISTDDINSENKIYNIIDNSTFGQTEEFYENFYDSDNVTPIRKKDNSIGKNNEKSEITNDIQDLKDGNEKNFKIDDFFQKEGDAFSSKNINKEPRDNKSLEKEKKNEFDNMNSINSGSNYFHHYKEHNTNSYINQNKNFIDSQELSNLRIKEHTQNQMNSNDNPDSFDFKNEISSNFNPNISIENYKDYSESQIIIGNISDMDL